MPLGHIVKEIWPAQSISIKGVKGQGQSQNDQTLVHDTPPRQDILHTKFGSCRSYSSVLL